MSDRERYLEICVPAGTKGVATQCGAKISAVNIHLPVGLVRIIADNGHEGWCIGVDEAEAWLIFRKFRDFLIGQDPLNLERMWQRFVLQDRIDLLSQNLRGQLDVALWDLAGKTVGLPVHQLIGGYRHRIPCYRSGNFLLKIDDYVQDAVQAKREGFFGYKDHCYLGADAMIEVAKQVRQAVGPDFHLMHDAVQVYNYPDALRVARELERQDFFWFEEPLREYDALGLKKLSDAVDVPIAAGEFLPGAVHSTAQLLARQAVDIVRASVPYRGGITDMIKIARLAEAFGIQCELTSLGTLHGFVHAHAIAAIKNTTYFEAWAVGSLGGNPAVRNHLMLEDGHVTVPQGPGLGLELDWEKIESQTETLME